MKVLTKILEGLGVVIFALGIIFILSLIFSLPVLWLWNWLCPDLFGLPELTWLQAWGLNLLTGIMFGNVYSAANSNKK